MTAYILNLFDLACTLYALSIGCTELNPLMQNIPIMVIFKVVIVGGLCWWLSKRTEPHVYFLKRSFDLMANRFFPNYSAYKITSPYGFRTINGVSSMHNGIDLVAKMDNGASAVDYITAHTGGIVDGVGYDASAGYFVRIKVADGVLMYYFHLREKSSLKHGAKVDKGAVIGYMGSTGNSTGAHLHWGIKVNGKWIDPTPYLDKDYPVKEEKEYTFSVTLRALKRGDTGEDVRALQALLIGYGYSVGDYGTDGSFGPSTDNALRSYQTGHGLAADGSAGPETFKKLLGI